MPTRNSLHRRAALGAAAVLALAGCTNDTGEETDTVSEDQAALVELGERLNGADGHAYTAAYLVEGTGTSVLLAVDPEAATAAVVVDDRPEFWTGEDVEEIPGWLSGELTGVLPTGGEVSEWLTATSGDPSARSEFSDTTLAGELADCVNVRGAAESPVGAFEVCVTTIGVIASITADLGEVTYTAKLVNYHDGVDDARLDELAGTSRHNNE
ncbi:hypothetical protein L0U85_10535 [Glycomyces sp. L485]|uniref:hypothetical protein n=1 Tax=Glycomyces sp. L485 TaxID=2909235 RepID=UPI001F4ADE9D|nr:hypothetical protein [Glycomyces sp. L485]MCH7231284.1 hypothetical protein [Glycomyces sp. L485]